MVSYHKINALKLMGLGRIGHGPKLKLKMSSPILLPAEVERLVENIQPIKLEDVGGKIWNRQHQTLEKLNMQVILNSFSATTSNP